jgi:hypothetical protein
MRNLILSTAVFTIILSACTKNNFEKEHPPVVTQPPIANPTPTPTSRDTCNDSIRYNPDIKRILNSNCATPGCHVQGAQDPDLSTYSLAKIKAERIKIRVCDDKDMPTAGPLTSACDLDKIKSWVAQGALENR